MGQPRSEILGLVGNCHAELRQLTRDAHRGDTAARKERAMLHAGLRDITITDPIGDRHWQYGENGQSHLSAAAIDIDAHSS